MNKIKELEREALKLREMGHFDASNEIFYFISKKNVTSIWPVIQIGINLRYLKRFEESEKIFEKNIELYKYEPYFIYEYALALIANDKVIEAEKYFIKLLNIDKEFEFKDFLEMAIGIKKRNFNKIKSDNKYYRIIELINIEGYYKEYEDQEKVLEDINKLIKINTGLEEFLIDKSSINYSNEIKIKSEFEICNEIKKAIYQKNPYSLVRVGDGEGVMLKIDKIVNLKEKSNNNKFSEMAKSYFLKRWFGENYKKNISNELYELSKISYEKSDALCLSMQYKYEYDKTIIENYGNMRATEYVIETKKQIGTNNIIEKLLLNTDIFEYLLIENKFNIKIITCHEIIAEKLKKFTEKVEIIKIPWHHEYARMMKIKESMVHIEEFNNIINNINKSEECDLFIVGAGYLGKIYCETIRSNGGRAIDVGALLDIIANYNTRDSLVKIWEKSKINQLIKLKENEK